MADPVVESIAVDIETKVNEIVTPEFNYGLKAVRPTRTQFKTNAWNDLDVLIVQLDESDRKDRVGSFGIEEVKQPFALLAITRQSDNAETSIDKKNNLVAADIEKKLMEDITRNDFAFSTDVIGKATIDESEKFSGIMLVIEVDYYVKKGDPYTKG
jgi:hypothetical protein